MDRIDLIIDALAYARACIGRQLTSKDKLNHNLDKLHEAMDAARKLKDDLYAQEMQQPTPTQSGTISITVNKRLEADIDLLNKAKKSAVQEPVAWVAGYKQSNCVVVPIDGVTVFPTGLALYTAPAKREWVGLTDDEIDELLQSPMSLEPSGELGWVRCIEAALKEKNHV